jgi:cell division protein FtsB
LCAHSREQLQRDLEQRSAELRAAADEKAALQAAVSKLEDSVK